MLILYGMSGELLHEFSPHSSLEELIKAPLILCVLIFSYIFLRDNSVVEIMVLLIILTHRCEVEA